MSLVLEPSAVSCAAPAACSVRPELVRLAGARWVLGAEAAASECRLLDGFEAWLTAPAAWWAAGAVGLRILVGSPIGLHEVTRTTLDRIGDSTARLGRLVVRGAPCELVRVELRQIGGAGALGGVARVGLRAWSSASVPPVSVAGEVLGDGMTPSPVVAPVAALGMAFDAGANLGAGGWSRVRLAASGGVLVAPALATSVVPVVVAVGAVRAPLSAVPLPVVGPIALVVMGTVPVYVGDSTVTTATGFPLSAGSPGGGIVLGVADAADLYVVAGGAGSSVRALLPLP